MFRKSLEMKKLKIDIVSDVVCPWCTVGYKRLEKAIKELGIEDQIEIEWQPFELNPGMHEGGQNRKKYLTEKYSFTEEQFNASQQQIIDAGAELGFTFDYFDEMKTANTFDAHILLEYAKKFNKQTELKMRLTKAYFSDRMDVSKKDVLKQALLDVGLDAKEGLALLDDEDARNELLEKEAYWKSMGINSVPTVVFDKKSAVTGAQPVDVFKEVLSEVLDNKTI